MVSQVEELERKVRLHEAAGRDGPLLQGLRAQLSAAKRRAGLPQNEQPVQPDRFLVQSFKDKPGK